MTNEEDREKNYKDACRYLGINPCDNPKPDRRKPGGKSSAKVHDDDDDDAVLAAEEKLAKQGLRRDDYTIIRPDNSAPKELPISRKPAKRVDYVGKALRTSGDAAVAAPSDPSRNATSGILLDLFKQSNQANINFYDNLRAQSKSLAEAKPFEFELFHQAEQPKYNSFKSLLISHGFKVISHGEKDHFCWKANDRFYHVAVDRAHGTQAEKGKAAGWWLRLQQHIAQSGLIAKQ